MLDIPAHTAGRRPLLLREPLHRSSRSAESLDFQVRVGRPDPSERGPQTPCVLVLSRTADREIDELSLALAAAGVPILRLDSDRAPDHDLCWDPRAGVVIADGAALRPVVCWSRYFTAGSIPVASADAALAAYARAQWSAATGALAATPGVRHVNPAPAPDRLAQLDAARAAGLATPATVVTNAPAEALRWLPGHGDVIVKSVGEHFVEPRAGELTGLTPRRLTRAQVAAEAQREPAPVIVQEFLGSARELRIYAVGGRLCSFAVAKPSLSALWDGGQELVVGEIPTPPLLEAPLRRLLRRWDLDVAAFDFLDTPNGAVFLEVNPACDWLWCERRAGVAHVGAAVRGLVETAYRREVAA